MLSNPRLDQRVQVWYGERSRQHMPYHGCIGRVKIISRARRARNHGIEVALPGGSRRIIAIPAGNLRMPRE